jgi:hypothetical protein
MLVRLLNDEAGFVISSELALVATILVIGVVVGLVAIRDAVLQELVDVAQTIGTFNQSYSYTGVTGHTASSSGGVRTDLTDFCDEGTATGGADDAQLEPACLNIQIAPAVEG